MFNMFSSINNYDTRLDIAFCITNKGKKRMKLIASKI